MLIEILLINKIINMRNHQNVDQQNFMRDALRGYPRQHTSE